MKAIRPFLYVVAAVLLVASVVVFYNPIRELLGRWNTSYSSKFSPDRFAHVTIGISRSTVVELLGTPLETDTLTNYPVWALRDEGVRVRYGKDTKLQIETLLFSRPKRGGDYDRVSVWIGPDTNVIEYERWVTD